jgi:hypothetical protein
MRERLPAKVTFLAPPRTRTGGQEQLLINDRYVAT